MIHTTITVRVEKDKTYLVISASGRDGYNEVDKTWEIDIEKLIELGIAKQVW